MALHFNNRMPEYVFKKPVKVKRFHTEVKDGIIVHVEGKKVNPYEGIDCESLKLKARIDTGLFVNSEGHERTLEKANGSDLLTRQVENAERELELMKEREIVKRSRAKLKKAVAEKNKEVAEFIDD